jgi:hypothetical protein
MYARQASTMHLCELHARVHGPLGLLGAVCRNQDVFEHLYSYAATGIRRFRPRFKLVAHQLPCQGLR